jgi:hypothetical protein
MTQATRLTPPPLPSPQPDNPITSTLLALGGRRLVALAAAHRQRQQALALAARNRLRTLWRFVDGSNPQGSWAGVAAHALSAMTAAQSEAARGAQEYVTAALSAQGVASDPFGTVPAAAFAGAAADGRNLSSLLGYPAFEVSAFVDGGMDHAQAVAIGGRHLERIVATETADAARVSTGVAIVNDRKTAGFIRYLTPPSCSRCVILAGLWYRYDAGFDRHPQCFPAGVILAGPKTLAATRRWYEGELVHLATASGQYLPLTGNHPVLTRRGWIPANLLQEGDEVFRSTRAKGATALVVPDHQQVPALIENVWSALSVPGLRRMPSATEDFHGDGQDGEVDVVYADRALRDEGNALVIEDLSELALTLGGQDRNLFPPERLAVLVDAWDASQSRGGVRASGLTFALGRGHLCGSDLPSLARPSSRYAVLAEPSLDHVPAYSVLPPEGVFTGAAEVGERNLLDREHLADSRWDAPAGPLTVENRVAYASRGEDLSHRLAGQIEADRLVDVRRVQWSGHVYSLTSSEGWNSANSLIVSNCDCIGLPAAEVIEPQSPKAMFDEMDDAGLKRAGWSDADVKAIRDGADIYQVTNARRELHSVTVAGQQLRATRVGTTKRGLAGKRLGKRGIRLTPASLYSEAGRLGWSRDELLNQMKRHGYIV